VYVAPVGLENVGVVPPLTQIVLVFPFINPIVTVIPKQDMKMKMLMPFLVNDD
jgi:hypothetical protein